MAYNYIKIKYQCLKLVALSIKFVRINKPGIKAAIQE